MNRKNYKKHIPKRNFFYNYMIKCPVCKILYINQGLSNHIINYGEGECWRRMNIWLDLAKNKPFQTSPAIWLRNSPHLAYWRRNQKIIKKFQLKVDNKLKINKK